jgi:hypothetical protein
MLTDCHGSSGAHTVVVMAWASLSTALGTKPRVLAGPLLRKVTPENATVWLALRKPARVTLKVLDPGGLRMLEGSRPRRPPPAWCRIACAPTRRNTGFPLLPQRAQPTDPSMTFRLGALPRVAPGGPATPLRPRGRLLVAAVQGPEAHPPRGRGPARGRPRHARLLLLVVHCDYLEFRITATRDLPA